MDIRELGQEYCSLLDEEESGEIAEDDSERLSELKKLNDELEDALYYYNTSDVQIIKKDEAEDYTENYIAEVMGVDLNEYGLKWFFKFDEYWEQNIAPDWDELEWEGEEYYYRSW